MSVSYNRKKRLVRKVKKNKDFNFPCGSKNYTFVFKDYMWVLTESKQ